MRARVLRGLPCNIELAREARVAMPGCAYLAAQAIWFAAFFMLPANVRHHCEPRIRDVAAVEGAFYRKSGYRGAAKLAGCEPDAGPEAPLSNDDRLAFHFLRPAKRAAPSEPSRGELDEELDDGNEAADEEAGSPLEVAVEAEADVVFVCGGGELSSAAEQRADSGVPPRPPSPSQGRTTPLSAAWV